MIFHVKRSKIKVQSLFHFVLIQLHKVCYEFCSVTVCRGCRVFAVSQWECGEFHVTCTDQSWHTGMRRLSRTERAQIFTKKICGEYIFKTQTKVNYSKKPSKQIFFKLLIIFGPLKYDKRHTPSSNGSQLANERAASCVPDQSPALGTAEK